jgi:hypothetical protein
MLYVSDSTCGLTHNDTDSRCQSDVMDREIIRVWFCQWTHNAQRPKFDFDMYGQLPWETLELIRVR